MLYAWNETMYVKCLEKQLKAPIFAEASTIFFREYKQIQSWACGHYSVNDNIVIFTSHQTSTVYSKLYDKQNPHFYFFYSGVDESVAFIKGSKWQYDMPYLKIIFKNQFPVCSRFSPFFFFFLLECNGSDWKQVWTWNCTMGKFSSSKETLVKFVFQFPSYGWEVPRQNFLPLIKFRLLSLWNRLLPAFHVLLPLVYTFSFSLSNAKISWSLPLWYLF